MGILGLEQNLTIKLVQELPDVNQLASLLQELDEIHHKAAPERFPLHSLEKRKEDIRKIFEQGYLFYAETGSYIVGFASVLKKKEALMIEHLYVLPKFRCNQIATKLIECIFGTFPDKEIFASVNAFNSEAIKFYDKNFELSSLVFRKIKKNRKRL